MVADASDRGSVAGPDRDLPRQRRCPQRSGARCASGVVDRPQRDGRVGQFHADDLCRRCQGRTRSQSSRLQQSAGDHSYAVLGRRADRVVPQCRRHCQPRRSARRLGGTGAAVPIGLDQPDDRDTRRAAALVYLRRPAECRLAGRQHDGGPASQRGVPGAAADRPDRRGDDTLRRRRSRARRCDRCLDRRRCAGGRRPRRAAGRQGRGITGGPVSAVGTAPGRLSPAGLLRDRSVECSAAASGRVDRPAGRDPRRVRTAPNRRTVNLSRHFPVPRRGALAAGGAVIRDAAHRSG